MSLFDQPALARIESSIREVEKNTSGEIVVVSVGRSDDYHAVRLAYGVACALGSAAVIHWFFPRLPVGGLLWIEAAMIAAVWFALSVPALLRALVPGSVAAYAVARRAQIAFLDRRVFDTRDRTGVLILISELEHRVTILGDEGIYAQLQEAGFQAYVDRVVTAIRTGRAADGLCEVIADLGGKLGHGLPVKTDDRNELPDAVQLKKR